MNDNDLGDWLIDREDSIETETADEILKKRKRNIKELLGYDN